MSRDVVYYDITVREKFEEGLPLFDDLLMVFYLNTSQYDPRLITDYNLLRTDFSDFSDTYMTFGNIINRGRFVRNGASRLSFRKTD